MEIVTSSGGVFRLQGRPFCPVGFNAYYLLYCGAETQAQVIGRAYALGANVLRVWLFGNQPGLDLHAAFDSCLALAEPLGMRLLPVLTNYWPDFGGMRTHLALAAVAGNVALFYTSPQAERSYHQHIESVIARRSQLTGKLRSEDGTILAWELANEPRNPENDGAIVQERCSAVCNWADRASCFVRSLDSHHLIGVGDEGFFAKEKPGPARAAHLYDGRYGADHLALLSLAAIDFGTFHFYPEDWSVGSSYQSRWIRHHVSASRSVGKPTIFEEFGICGEEFGYGRMPAYRHAVHEALSLGCAGVLIWMLGGYGEAYGYRDRYVLH